MRQLLFFIFSGFLIILASCRSDFETVKSTGDLQFSKDTVFLDTVFSTISSRTYTLKVYNKSKADINIPSIQLGRGLASKYRMSVDGLNGIEGKIFNDVTLLAKDSMFIYIETTANFSDANAKDFLYTDQILFDSGADQQKVELVTLVKDAVLLFPERSSTNEYEMITVDDQKITGFFLEENNSQNGNELIFTNKKAYVIYGNAAVPEGKTVVFEPGARVYFHKNSSLILTNNSCLKINGAKSSNANTLENEVIFEGDRLESNYSNVPGQWTGIVLTKGSINHTITNLTLKNATTGILIESEGGNPIEIKNSQIYNCTNYGILAKNAKIKGENLALNNAGVASLACTYGGEYNFTHCTINNNWSSSKQVALLVSNSTFKENVITKDLVGANFNNCIIYGNYTNELSLRKDNNAAFNYQFSNCLVKFDNKSASNSNDPLYQFLLDPTHYNQILLNIDPKFLDDNENDFNIEQTSPAFAKGNSNYNISTDILGITRTLPPDLGAYQSKPFPKK